MRKSEADRPLSCVALDVWENEGGALAPGVHLEPSSEPDTAGGEEKPLTLRGAVTPGDDIITQTSSVRTWNAVVSFRRPFILDGFGDIQPAGAYAIDTEEKLSRTPADGETWRRTDTKIRLVRYGVTKYVSVDPDALLAALHRDNAQSDSSSAENTAKARLSSARRLNALSWR